MMTITEAVKNLHKEGRRYVYGHTLRLLARERMIATSLNSTNENPHLYEVDLEELLDIFPPVPEGYMSRREIMNETGITRGSFEYVVEHKAPEKMKISHKIVYYDSEPFIQHVNKNKVTQQS